MKALLTTAALFAAALFILDVPAANAADKYFYHTQGTAQEWSSDSWYSDKHHGSSTSEPTSSDHAIIEDDCYLDADEVCQRFTVKSGIQLELASVVTGSGYRLDVGDQDGRTSYVDGTVLLSDDTSKLRFMYAHTVQPATTNSDGYITGEHNSAVIDDDPSNARILTIAMDGTGELIIQGALKVQLSLVNNSRVLADDGTTDEDTRDTLLLYSGTVSGSGVWEVAKAIGDYTAFLEFGSGITSATVTGDFVVSDGTLYIDDVVSTSGGLCFTGGKIDVQASDSFTATGAPASCP